MTREDMLARVKALRDDVLKDNDQTWEENFVWTMLDACMDRLSKNAVPLHLKALDLSLAGERFKTWMDMGWSMKEDYSDWRIARMHEALNNMTEAAWQVYCNGKEESDAD